MNMTPMIDICFQLIVFFMLTLMTILDVVAGFTTEAGYNLAIAAWRSGQRYLLVVLGAQTRSLSFRDARTVLRYGFYEAGIEAAPPPPAGKRTKPALPPRRPGERRSRAALPGTS